MKLKLSQLLTALRVRCIPFTSPASSGDRGNEQAAKTIEGEIIAARKRMRERQRIRVRVSIDSQESPVLRKHIASLLKRELRRLGDVDLVDASDGGGIYDLRVVVVSAAGGTAGETIAVSLILNIRENRCFEGGEPLAGILRHECCYLFQCLDSQLASHCEVAVSWLDEESFSYARKRGSADAEWIREYIEQLGVQLQEIKATPER